MTPADLSRLSTLLDEALDLPLPEREAWLGALEGEAAALAATLRRLLARAALEETDDRPPSVKAAQAAPASPAWLPAASAMLNPLRGDRPKLRAADGGERLEPDL